MLDASGIVHISDNRYLIAEDELDILRYFTLDVDNLSFHASGEEVHLGHDESDFESLAYDRESHTVYCIGSHSNDISQNLMSFRPDGKGITVIPFQADRVLNDVNIESLTIWNSHLLMGYRSPRYNKLAIALIFVPETGAQVLVDFDLGGRVFRDMTRIDDGNFLILAGPQKGKHYKKLPSRLYWWNGDLFNPKVVPIDLNLDGIRAEGVAARQYADKSVEVLIGTDESRVKNSRNFRMLYFHVSNIDEILSSRYRYKELVVQI